MLESVDVAQADRGGDHAALVEALLQRGDLKVFENLHHIVHLEVVETYLVSLGGYFFHYAGIGDSVGRCCLVGHCEAGSAQQDAAEIADHYYQDVAQLGGEDLAEDGTAGGGRRLAVVIGAPLVAGQAETVGIAVMPCVEIFLFEGGYDVLDLGFGRNRMQAVQSIKKIVGGRCGELCKPI